MPIRQGTYITIDRYGEEHIGHLEELFPRDYREPSDEEVAEAQIEICKRRIEEAEQRSDAAQE